METQEERLYQRLVALGMMPSAAEKVISRARAMGERLPTAADAWRDAEEDTGPAGQESSRQAFIYAALLRPSMRRYARILEARTPSGRSGATAPTASTAKHYGPGDHPGGSGQAVHGRRHGLGQVERGSGLRTLADFMKMEDEGEIEGWLQANLLTRFRSDLKRRVWINWPEEEGKRESTLALVRAAAQELVKLEAEFGERPDFLSVDPGEDASLARVVQHEYGRHRLALRFYYGHNFGLLQDEITHLADNGYGVSRTVADMVAHEYGHVLMFRHGRERVANQVYRSYNWETLGSQLSRRAAEDAWEMFSEAFAARDRNPLAAEIVAKILGSQK